MHVIMHCRPKAVKSSCKWSFTKVGLQLYEYKAAFFRASDCVVEEPTLLIVAPMAAGHSTITLSNSRFFAP